MLWRAKLAHLLHESKADTWLPTIPWQTHWIFPAPVCCVVHRVRLHRGPSLPPLAFRLLQSCHDYPWRPPAGWADACTQKQTATQRFVTCPFSCKLQSEAKLRSFWTQGPLPSHYLGSDMFLVFLFYTDPFKAKWMHPFDDPPLSIKVNRARWELFYTTIRGTAILGVTSWLDVTVRVSLLWSHLIKQCDFFYILYE